jgi:signal transduction histidine kinase
MTRSRRSLPAGSAHAARVALAASLLIGLVYAGCVTVLDRAVTARLVAAVDSRLQERLSDVREGGPAVTDDDDDDSDDLPLYVWRITRGAATALTPGAPRLPALGTGTVMPATTDQVAHGPFRLDSMRYGGVILVAGQSLAEQDHVEAVLGVGEALAAPVLLLAAFAGAMAVGLRALSPVEQSRRRQLEFTADASHELRTPLSVIGAETSLALSSTRSAAGYRSALVRVQDEAERLRSIVEDLLWLARFDSNPPQPGNEPLDLATIAAGCADRFRAVAGSRAIDIVISGDGPGPSWISAPPEWIDRLVGVLMDNACRHAGHGGTVRIGVGRRGSRVLLTVEDSGPGIQTEDRERLFDRFHRATQQGGGAGLGLAIADSIVRSTGGQWRIADSALGGALFQISWRRSKSSGGDPPGGDEPVRRQAYEADAADKQT